MGHGKPAYNSQKVKHTCCPFKNLCVFNGEVPKAILTECEYLWKRVDKFEFGMDTKELFKYAIFLHNMHPALNNEEYRPACKNIRKRFKELRSCPELEHHETDNICKCLITFKNELFVFLKYPAIPPMNNPIEQGARNAVLFRKISFGNMTEHGKRNISVIMTILRIAKLRKLDPIKVLVAIMGNNAMPTLPERFLLRAIPETT